MAKRTFDWHQPLDGRLWVAQLQISNSEIRHYRQPRLQMTFMDPAASHPPRKIEIWEESSKFTVDHPIDVFDGMVSVAMLLKLRANGLVQGK
jgi:hypothetical protein